MQTATSSGAAVPAPDLHTPNGPSAIPKHYRYSSRSNSFSSASVVTVKRTASLSSSGAGSRSSALPIRAQSPADASLIALRVGREQLPQDRSRRKSVAVDATERPNNAILGSSHKHSSSVASSVASPSSSKRSRASSGAIFGGLREQTASPKKRSAATIDYSPRASLQRPYLPRASSNNAQTSPATSPERERRRRSRPEITNPLNSLPSLNATPALTDPNDVESPSTIPTVTTPSTQASYKPDYFVDHSTSPNNNVKNQPPTMLRNVDSSHDGPDTHGNETAFSSSIVSRPPVKDTKSDAPPPLTSKDNGRRKTRTREKGEKEKKVMLSQALQRANNAVYLDNVQNFEAALLAYLDACSLLQQVMDRTTGTDDKRKLEAIKSTYASRVEELRQMDTSQTESGDEKSLPPRPTSNGSSTMASPTIDASIQNIPSPDIGMLPAVSGIVQPKKEPAPVELDASTTITRPVQKELLPAAEFEQPHAPQASLDIGSTKPTPSVTEPANIQIPRAEDKDMLISPLNTKNLHLAVVPDERDIPAPLSPNRGNSPQKSPGSQMQLPIQLPDLPELPAPDADTTAGAIPNLSQSSWLDTIDEDRSSRGSSVHSVSSQQGLRRKDLRPASVGSHADFDAAFDAAVEAAYDQGLEPDLDGGQSPEEVRNTHMSHGSINVRASEIVEISSPNTSRRLYGDPILGADEEEEKLMDAIARDYGRAFNFDLSSKSALPRQSDSSGYSRSTWQSTSDRTTAGTSLTTVAEDGSPITGSKNAFAATSSMNSILAEPSHPVQPPSHPPPAIPPPQSSLPPPPQASQPQLPGSNPNRLSGVRSRRLSSQNSKQLKIETFGKSDARQGASTLQHASNLLQEGEEPNEDFKSTTAFNPLTVSESAPTVALKSLPSWDLQLDVADSSAGASTTTLEQRRSLDGDQNGGLSARPTLIKKNKSSVSLRGEHMVLLSSPTFDTGLSLTPLSSTFMSFASKRNTETPLTSQRATLPSLGSTAAESGFAGVLFSTSLTASEPVSPPKSPAAPTAVEPCPESFLLRPFWLMRNMAATLIHPNGGFLTSRLFVPREAWLTKGVKLKSVEDKIAVCDLLTASLGRLAGVDTYDADAVLDGLQVFEEIMDRVQATLVKKLGSEVGVNGLPGMFKEASTANTANPALTSDTSTLKGGKDGKGYLTSWRKLRSKSSGTPTTTTASLGKAGVAGKGSDPDSFSMPSVPMTSWISVERRGQKKDVRNLVFEGEHKHYMSSLASLFESVQILDQIARQVEDPGLKAASSTHVGMELSIRHAAEFFGFYICRFVLADVGLLLDKFVKRGSEWILA